MGFIDKEFTNVMVTLNRATRLGTARGGKISLRLLKTLVKAAFLEKKGILAQVITATTP